MNFEYNLESVGPRDPQKDPDIPDSPYPSPGEPSREPPDPYPGPDPGEQPPTTPQIRTTSIFADRRLTMPENPQELKGRAKQAAGDLTDDKELKREGQVDKAAGKTKEGVEKLADKAKERIGGDR